MSIGLCCMYVEPVVAPRSGKVSYKDIFDSKVLQLGRWKDGKYSHRQVKETYVHNAKAFEAGFRRIVREGYRSFRASSSLFPLWDQVPSDLWNNEDVVAPLRRVGQLAKEKGVRVTTHPGQFCSLSSDNELTVAKSIHELWGHAWLFDVMGFDESPLYAINIHGAKADRTKELISVINDLPDNIRKRLTLENDEMSYSAVDLMEVSRDTKVPVVFDVHHHTFNDGGLSMSEAIEMTMKSWGDVKPLQHLSNTDPNLKDGNFCDRRKHSDMVHYVPEEQLELLKNDKVDVEAEFKLKNLAINKMLVDFCLSL